MVAFGIPLTENCSQSGFQYICAVGEEEKIPEFLKDMKHSGDTKLGGCDLILCGLPRRGDKSYCKFFLSSFLGF